MIIDWHAHVYPPELAKERRWGGESPLTIENLLEAHARAGIDLRASDCQRVRIDA
jgi:hypothetical protein